MGFFKRLWNGTTTEPEDVCPHIHESIIREKEEEVRRISALCRELRDDRDKAMKGRDELTEKNRDLVDALGKRVAEIEGWKITAKDLADRIVEKDKKIERIEGVVTSTVNKCSAEISDLKAEIERLKKLNEEYVALWRAVIDASKPMLEVIKAKDNIIPF